MPHLGIAGTNICSSLPTMIRKGSKAKENLSPQQLCQWQTCHTQRKKENQKLLKPARSTTTSAVHELL